MTWVVGATSVFGYGALYSDIQVTFSDGTTQDRLQKAYPITNFIAAGFVGSVRIGFCLLQSLAEYTCLPDEALSSQAWDPVWVGAFVGLIPSEYSSGPSRRQGGITKAGNGRARRALIEGAWAYRHPAKVSQHIQTRIDALPEPIQDLGWKAQVRLCKRFVD